MKKINLLKIFVNIEVSLALCVSAYGEDQNPVGLTNTTEDAAMGFQVKKEVNDD